jgi:hypothetical protein
MLDQLSILLTHPLRQTKNTYLLANDRLPEIASDKYIEAFEPSSTRRQNEPLASILPARGSSPWTPSVHTWEGPATLHRLPMISPVPSCIREPT